MKKTLFLATIAAAAATPAFATLDGVRVDPGRGVYVSTDITVDSSNKNNYLEPGTFDLATVSGGVVIGTSHGDSTLTVDGVGVSTPGNLYISGNGGGDQRDTELIPGEMNTGTVVLKNGATLEVSSENDDWNGMQLQVGTCSVASTGTLTVESGSKVDVGPRMYVGGGSSTGVLTVTGAKSSVLVSGKRVWDADSANVIAVIGTDAGSTGTVTVEQGGSLEFRNNGFYNYLDNFVVVGEYGNGTLNVSGEGSSVTSSVSQFVVGYDAGVKGVVNISDNAAFSSSSSDFMYVGYYGEGEFNVTGSENVTCAGTLGVGVKEGSEGTIRISEGSDVLFNSMGPIRLGYEGKATLDVSDGSAVTFFGEVDVAYCSGSEGYINVTDGSSVKLENHSLFLGNLPGSEGHLTVDSDSSVEIFGLLSSGYEHASSVGGSTIDNAGTITAGRGVTLRNGTVVTNSGTLENTSNEYNITVMEGSSFLNTETGVIHSTDGMRVDIGAEMTNNGTITSEGNGFRVGDSSTLTNTGTISTETAMVVLGGAVVNNSGELTIEKSDYESEFYGLMVSGGAGLTNTGTINTDTFMAVQEGASLYNTGSITLHKTAGDEDSYGFYIGKDANIFTGVVSVSGRPDQLSSEVWSELTEDQITYDTGIYFADEGGSFVDGSNGTVTLGALIEGEDTLQYLYKKDWQTIQNSIASGLGVSGTGVTYANEIGKNISAHFTTDEVSGDDSFIVAIGDGEVVVDRGENKDCFDGTIGSYSEDINESKADIRLDEKAGGGHVSWGGDTLKTVDTNKDTVFTPNVKVDFINEGGSRRTDGKLVVVKDTTLRGTGTLDGTLVVEDGAVLRVGAPDGVMTVGAAELSGAVVFSVTGADTCSQLALADGTGSLTFTPTATISIKLCSDDILPVWSPRGYEFDLTLATGIDFLKVWDETFTGNTLTASAVEHLKGMTSFSLDPEALGIPDFDAETAVNPVEFTYTLESDGKGSLALHVKGRMTVPEPATATLSLLALAGLCARRRRK